VKMEVNLEIVMAYYKALKGEKLLNKDLIIWEKIQLLNKEDALIFEDSVIKFIMDIYGLIKSMKYGSNPKKPLKFKEYLRWRKKIFEANERAINLYHNLKWE